MRRAKFGLSHYRLMTLDMGELVPVGCVEVLPGDTFQQRTSALIRVSPLVAPVMHPVVVRIHHWFVPNRLVWTGWEDFITGGADGLGGSAGAFPELDGGVGGFAAGGLLDYLGVPPAVPEVEVSALPVRAYNEIFNEFYRDEDLVPVVGQDSLTLQKVSWEKDYFTASRPWPQRGPTVVLPLGTRANVLGLGVPSAVTAVPDAGGTFRETGGAAPVTYPFNEAAFDSGTSQERLRYRTLTGVTGAYPDIYADLTTATGATVQQVRLSFALQRYQEARARFGSRYTEYLRYLGVRSSDARLQRPEYLGGGKQTISFSEVLQTAPSSSPAANVGELKGHGIAALRSGRYRRFFEEHGHVLTLMSVRPKAMYSRACHRNWFRRTKEEYYQRELETIGQQELFRREVYAEQDPAGATVFGYTDRYREYREHPSSVHGEFRSTLNFWHLAREFAAPPVLNQSFVECVPSKRIHAVSTNDVLWVMVNHSIQARRMVSQLANARII